MSIELVGVIGGGVLGAFAFIFNRIIAINKRVDSRPDHKMVGEKITKEIRLEMAPQIVEIKHIKEDTEKIKLQQEKQGDKIDKTHETVVEISTMLKTRKELRIDT